MKVLTRIYSPKMTVRHVRQELDKELGATARVPSLEVLRLILKDTFFLKHATCKGDHYRYNDSTWDTKRLWVCRILAQFLM